MKMSNKWGIKRRNGGSPETSIRRKKRTPQNCFKMLSEQGKFRL